MVDGGTGGGKGGGKGIWLTIMCGDGGGDLGDGGGIPGGGGDSGDGGGGFDGGDGGVGGGAGGGCMLTQIFSQQLSQPYPTQLLQVPSSKRWQQSAAASAPTCATLRSGGWGLGGGNPAGRGGNGGMGGYKYCRPPKPEHSWTRPSRPRASARGRALAIAAQGRAITAVFRSVDITELRGADNRQPASKARYCRPYWGALAKRFVCRFCLPSQNVPHFLLPLLLGARSPCAAARLLH